MFHIKYTDLFDFQLVSSITESYRDKIIQTKCGSMFLLLRMKIEIMYVPRFTFCFSTLSVSEDNWSICSALPIRKQNTTASTFIVVPKTLRWIGCAAENQLKFNTWDWQSPNSSLLWRIRIGHRWHDTWWWESEVFSSVVLHYKDR